MFLASDGESDGMDDRGVKSRSLSSSGPDGNAPATFRQGARLAALLGVLLCAASPVRADGPKGNSSHGIPPEAGPLLLERLKVPGGSIPEAGQATLLSISIRKADVEIHYDTEQGPARFLVRRHEGGCDGGVASRWVCVESDCARVACTAIARWIGRRIDAEAGNIWQSLPSVSWWRSIRGTWVGIAGACWVVLLVVLLAAAVRRIRNREWDLLWIDLVLVLSALAVRLLVATWGPGALSPNLTSLMTAREQDSHGVGPYPLAALLLALFDGGDRPFVVMNLVAGSLAPALLHAFLRCTGSGGRRLGILAALVLVFLPLPIRFAGEANRQTLILFLSLVSLWGVARIRRGAVWTSLGAATVGTLLTFMTRPEGVLLFVPLGLLALVRFGREGTTLSLGAVGVSLVGFVFYFLALPHEFGNTSGLHLTQTALGWFHFKSLISPVFQSWLNPGFTPFAFILLMFLGALVAVRDRRFIGLWALAFLVFLGPIFSLYPPGLGGKVDIENVRFQTLSFVSLSILAALGTMAVLDRLNGLQKAGRLMGGALLAAVVVVSCFRSYGQVLGPVDIDHEYAYLTRWVTELPQDAEVHYIDQWGDGRVSSDISLRAPAAGLSWVLGRPDVTWHSWPYDPGRPGRPRFLLFPALCGHARTIKDEGDLSMLVEKCELLLRVADPVPFRQGWVTARRFVDSRPDARWLPIGLFRYPVPGEEGSPARR